MRGNVRQITLILKQYKLLKSELENTKRIYEKYKISSNILSPIDPTREGISKTNKISDPTENIAIYLCGYKNTIDRLTLQIETIDTAIQCLNEREKDIVKYKYFNDMNWREVAMTMDLCEKWCKEIKKEAFKKLIVTIPVEIFPSIFFE